MVAITLHFKWSTILTNYSVISFYNWIKLRHCKKSAPTIGQNQSRDIGLSVTNRQDRAVMNVNLCFFI